MQEDEKAKELSLQSASVLTPDCIKSFLDNITTEDSQETRKINLNHTLKNIRNHIIKTPNSIEKESLVNIFEIIKGVFVETSSELDYYKLSEMIFIIDNTLPQLNSHSLAVMTLSELANNTIFFNTLLVCIENYYKKIAGFEETHKSSVDEDFGLSFYATSIEILIKQTQSRYSECKNFLLKNLDAFKAVFFFYLQQVSILTNKRMEKIFELVLTLLKTFSKESDINSFASVFILSFLSEITGSWDSYLGFSILIVEFLQSSLTKENYKELFSLSPMFSEPLIVSLANPRYQELWFSMWDLMYNTIPKPELSSGLLQKFHKFFGLTYQQGVNIFLKKCKSEYFDVITVLANPEYIEKILNKINRRIASSNTVEIYSDTLELIFNQQVDEHVFKLTLNEKFLENEICQKKFWTVMKNVCDSKTDAQVSELLRFLETSTNFYSVKFLVVCLSEKSFKPITEKLLERNLAQVLIKILQQDYINVNKNELSELWKSFFSILIFCEHTKEIMNEKNTIILIRELQNEKYNTCRQRIIESCLEILEKILRLKIHNKKKIFLLSFDLMSYSYTSKQIEKFRSDIFRSLKLSKIGYSNIDLVVSIIIFHLKATQKSDIHLNFLKKCLIYNASPANVVGLTKRALKSEAAESVLSLIKEVLESTKRSSKFLLFSGTGAEVYNFKDSFKLSNKLSICVHVYIGKNIQDSVLFELQDEQNLHFSLRITNKKIEVFIKTGKNECPFISNTELLCKSWNFIGVSVVGGKNSIISVFNNGKIICTTISELKFSARLKKISVGGSLTNTQFFKGKISGLAVLKDFLTDIVFKALNENFYLNLNEETKNLKEKIFFALSPKIKLRIGNLEAEKKFSYCFRGKSLAKNFKYASCVLHELMSKDLSDEAVEHLLDIFIFVCGSEKSSLSSLVTSLVSTVHIRSNLYPKYINLISFLSLKVKKDVFQYFILNDIKTLQIPQDSFNLMLKSYRKTLRFTTFNFLLLRNLLKNMTEAEIRENLSVFLEDLKDFNTTAEILATLTQAKEYSLIQNLISVLTLIDFKEYPENLFKVLMNLLIFPQLNRASVYIYIIIFSYFLKPSLESPRGAISKDKNRAQELNKYFSYIKIKAVDVEPIIDAVLFLTTKGINFTEKTNVVNLFELVLSSVHILARESFHKFYEFLQYFVKYFNSAIIKSVHFPGCFISLCYIFHEKAGEVLIYIYSKIQKFKSFEKLVEFFRSIKDYSFSFNMFLSLFNTLFSPEFYLHRHLLTEMITILSFFSICDENYKEYFEIFSKFVWAIKENPKLLRFKVVTNESEGKIDENCLGNIFFTIAFQVFQLNHKSFELCKEILMLPEIDFLTKLKLDPKDEDYSILFCFLKISNLFIQNFPNFFEFLDRFIIKTKILEKIEVFISSQPEEKLSEIVNPNTSETGSDSQISNKRKFLEFLSQCRLENLSQLIITDEWLSLIQVVLNNLIISPFDRLLSSTKEIHLSRGSSKKSRASSLDCTSILAIQGKLESFTLKLEHLKYKFKQINKTQKFVHYQENNKKTYSVSNFQDTLLRPSRIKLITQPETENETRQRLYKNSLIRSRSTIDLSSILMSEHLNSSFLPESKESLHKSDNFLSEFELIKIKGSYFGKITIDLNFLQLKFEDIQKPANKGGALEFTIRKKRSTTIISSTEVFEILPRKFIHRSTAFEIFLLSGKSYFINFFQEINQQEALSSLKKWKKIQIIEDPTEILTSLRKKWIEGLISNFQYIMLLNKYSGRSFKDLSQYPVFPWVLTNFSSPILDLDCADNFRNFSFPISAQTESQRKDLTQRSKTKTAATLDDFQNGSHYSNGGIVLYYLVRIEPFTHQAKILHDGSLDHPNRIFFSMQNCWNSCLNVSDSKELIPEIFYLSEIFMNVNSLNLGINTLGKDSSVFELPAWASNCWDFVRKHRKALESGFCSRELHKWIDLVFGYRQRGKMARESFNLYMKVTYDDIFCGGGSRSVQDNIEGITDQIYHFGQTPRQVFFQPHLKKKASFIEDVFERMLNGSVNEVKIGIKISFVVLGIVLNDEFVAVVYKGEVEVCFLRYKICKKISDKGKVFVLKKTSFNNGLKFCVWGSFIVSYGYCDYKIRVHDFAGESITLINTSSIQPTGITGKTNLYYADFNIIFSIKSSLKLSQKYYGHLELVVSLSISENLLILASVSELGCVLLHDLKSAEILQKFFTTFITIHISEYNVLIGLSDKGYSLITLQGKLVSFTPLVYSFYVINKSCEYIIYQCSSGLVCVDLFETQEKFSKLVNLSWICVSESDKCLGCLSLESKDLIIFL